MQNTTNPLRNWYLDSAHTKSWSFDISHFRWPTWRNFLMKRYPRGWDPSLRVLQLCRWSPHMKNMSSPTSWLAGTALAPEQTVFWMPRLCCWQYFCVKIKQGVSEPIPALFKVNALPADVRTPKVTMASTVLTLAISDGQGPGTI